MSTDTTQAPVRSSVPDLATIVGDWDAGRPPPPDLRSRVRKVYFHALERRTFWAHRGGEIDAARAVAYQSIAGLIQRALEAPDADTDPEVPAGTGEAETLAAEIHSADCDGRLCSGPRSRDHRAAQTILASDWLAAHDRALVDTERRRLGELGGRYYDVLDHEIAESIRTDREYVEAHDCALLDETEQRILRGSWSDLAVMCIRTGFREARHALRNPKSDQ